MSHQAALPTGTIAVIAGGIDTCYPPEHKALQAEIGERGCVIAEQPLGFLPRAQDFPRRNRIISGIASAVLIVEAARRSGSLITARLAAEQGRDVFAVPGHPLDPRAEGTNQLLKDGAGMATVPRDVLDAIERQTASAAVASARLSAGMRQLEEPWTRAPEADVAVDSLDRVVAVLGPAPVNIDEIARATGLSIRVVQVAVLELVLAGRLEMHGSQLVSLRP